MDDTLAETVAALSDTKNAIKDAILESGAELENPNDFTSYSGTIRNLTTGQDMLNELNDHKTSGDHDGRYYTETEVDAALSDKSDTDHTHDGRYYTETEVDTKFTTANTNLTTHKTSTDHDGRYYTETEVDSKFIPKSGGTFTGNVDMGSFILTVPTPALPQS
jgi:hypothetical protein